MSLGHGALAAATAGAAGGGGLPGLGGGGPPGLSPSLPGLLGSPPGGPGAGGFVRPQVTPKGVYNLSPLLNILATSAAV
jgi:hypothetical protein